MLLKVIVKGGLIDKVSKAHLKVGGTLQTDDLDRVNDLVARKLCVIVSVDNPTTDEVVKFTFKEKEYEYEIEKVKGALKEIGISISTNAGVTGVSNKLEGLSDEQIQSLIDTLDKE